MEEKLLDINKWTQVENDWCGLYRYVIAPKCAYELIIDNWDNSKPIDEAKGMVCVLGLWLDRKTKTTTLEREWLGKDLTVKELLQLVVKDYEENMN